LKDSTMSKKTMAAAPMEETPVGAADAAAPAAAPAPAAPAAEPAPLPPTGGCWVRHPDGRLERVNDDGTPWVDPAAAAAAEADPAAAAAAESDPD
jgi:hypothetical protein